MLKNKMKIMMIFLLSAQFLYGCGQSETTEEVQQAKTSTIETNENSLLDTSELFTDRDQDASYSKEDCVNITLNDDSSSSTDDTVVIEGQTITIQNEGVYYVEGSLSDGSIVVNVSKSEKVQIIFDNVSIQNSSSACVNVKSADKVFITLAKKSKNTLISNLNDSKIDGAIYSQDDLTLNGSGKLIIESNAHGIVSKDDLKICQGTYNITSSKQGLSGKDSIRILKGKITVNSGTDSLHSENTEDENKGFIYIADGTFILNSNHDAISASNVIQIDGGTFNLSTQNGDTTVSAKGIKANQSVEVNGGQFTINSQDDSIHSNIDVLIYGGEFSLTTSDDGIHADSSTKISDGTITILSCYEGIEGQNIEISGGNIDITASDDGLNAAGGNDNNMNGPGEDIFAVDEDAYINIAGGNIVIDAGGDGIDSNGNLTMSGGTVYVNGPSNDGNGALDYNGEATISGGTIVAVGMSGMAQNFGQNSTQGTMLINLDEICSDEIVLKDSQNNELITFSPSKQYNSVVISCAGLSENEDYTLSCGTLEIQITLSSLVYTNQSTQPDNGPMNQPMDQGGMKMDDFKPNN